MSVAISTHPATARLRAHRRALIDLPESQERDEVLRYIDSQIVDFGQCESEYRALVWSRTGGPPQEHEA